MTTFSVRIGGVTKVDSMQYNLYKTTQTHVSGLIFMHVKAGTHYGVFHAVGAERRVGSARCVATCKRYNVMSFGSTFCWTRIIVLILSMSNESFSQRTSRYISCSYISCATNTAFGAGRMENGIVCALVNINLSATLV